jgi:integrase
MRRREPARVLGPYPQDQQWRIIEIDAKGRRKSYIADSRQAANRLAAKLRANLGARTVQATIELWAAARLRTGDAVPYTISEQSARARSLLAPVLELRLGDVTERKANALYERATTEPSKKTGLPLRPATHRFYLSIVQCMWQWAQKQGYAQSNPWAEVEPIGRVSAGKPQLRPAEARRFAQLAEQEAAAGSSVALAALCCLSLGLRASEALGLTGRDLDTEASEVYVSGTKTKAARRRLKVPPYLSALLARFAATRQPTERLCLATRQGLHHAVVMMCARAGVPRVCIHGLRGTHASLAVSGGASVEAVARVLGHTSTKMTLSHYITEEVATAARVAAVDASLSLPNHSEANSGENSPTGGSTSTLLSPTSFGREAATPSVAVCLTALPRRA